MVQGYGVLVQGDNCQNRQERSFEISDSPTACLRQVGYLMPRRLHLGTVLSCVPHVQRTLPSSNDTGALFRYSYRNRRMSINKPQPPSGKAKPSRLERDRLSAACRHAAHNTCSSLQCVCSCHQRTHRASQHRTKAG